jgi:ATP-dependent RNA circularization protein (DNA/RNA ligase family)
MSEFFRYPHTPHLAWFSSEAPRDDKVLSPMEDKAILDGDVVVEEKVDGANLGFSIAPDGKLRVQNRGQYLAEPHAGQFARLPAWLLQHDDDLLAGLTKDLMFFGEWCAARHSLDYSALPDWFLLFDVYDRKAGRFWSSARRNALASQIGLHVVPEVQRGKTSLADLKQTLHSRSSPYREGVMEGLVIRRESADWCDSRAKMVHPEFIQTITTHWRRRQIEWNRVLYESSGAT